MSMSHNIAVSGKLIVDNAEKAQEAIRHVVAVSEDIDKIEVAENYRDMFLKEIEVFEYGVVNNELSYAAAYLEELDIQAIQKFDDDDVQGFMKELQNEMEANKIETTMQYDLLQKFQRYNGAKLLREKFEMI